MRVLLPAPYRPGERITLDRGESHYVADVLRAGVGQGVQVFDGAGHAADAVVADLRDRTVTLELGAVRTLPRPQPAVHLVQALARAQKMDWIVQKATELGVEAIHPVVTEHAVVRLDPARAERKTGRWQAIALEACRQCGAAWAPRVEPVRTVDDALRAAAAELSLAGDPGPAATPLATVLEPLRDHPPASITAWIGPEGGFSSDELDRLTAAGTRTVHLGPTILRTETAPLYLLGVLRYLFG